MMMTIRSALIVLGCCFVAVSATSGGRGGTVGERLLHDLLSNYDSNVDPGIIQLKFRVSMLCSTYDKDSSVMTSSVWESHTWKDDRLAWNPAEYSDVETLRVPAKLLWTPDLRQYTSMTPQAERDDDVNAVLSSDGTVLWIPRAIYRTPAAVDSTGQITTDWRIGSWTYDGNYIELKADGSVPLELSYYIDSCPLVVARHKAEVVDHVYPCCEESYPSLDVSIAFKPRQQ